MDYKELTRKGYNWLYGNNPRDKAIWNRVIDTKSKESMMKEDAAGIVVIVAGSYALYRAIEADVSYSVPHAYLLLGLLLFVAYLIWGAYQIGLEYGRAERELELEGEIDSER